MCMQEKKPIDADLLIQRAVHFCTDHRLQNFQNLMMRCQEKKPNPGD